MLPISWHVIPTSPESHIGLLKMRMESVTVHHISSLSALGPKNLMNSCLLHPIHHFAQVLWHSGYSNLFYVMKSVFSQYGGVHILSTIYKHVHGVENFLAFCTGEGESIPSIAVKYGTLYKKTFRTLRPNNSVPVCPHSSSRRFLFFSPKTPPHRVVKAIGGGVRGQNPD